MKDDLHELIDGQLPDEQAAEMLHLLSVDPEKRSAFRQQMSLQRTLFRNEQHRSLSSIEEGEMLERVMKSSGETSGRTGRIARRGVTMLAVGLLLGGGAGYTGRALVEKPLMPQAIARDTVRVVEAPATSASNFDRDSVVSAIRDSLADANRASLASSARKSRVTPKRSSRTSTIGDPMTGRRVPASRR